MFGRRQHHNKLKTHSVSVVARLEAQPSSIVKESGSFGGLEKYLFAVARCGRVSLVVLEL